VLQSISTCSRCAAGAAHDMLALVALT
jgi:hypothetical protein